MFYVLDNNHRLQTWLPCINSIHSDDVEWHVYVDSFVLDTTCELVELLTTMTNLNKYVKIKPIIKTRQDHIVSEEKFINQQSKIIVAIFHSIK
jgi:hypothetical protein